MPDPLLRLLDARRILEVGTFTGCGTLWIAPALPADGQLITCDISEEIPQTGRA